MHSMHACSVTFSPKMCYNTKIKDAKVKDTKIKDTAIKDTKIKDTKIQRYKDTTKHSVHYSGPKTRVTL